MKVVLYMAVSADGFIAGPSDETPWSDEEWEAFKEFIKSCDAVLLGRRTYEIMNAGGEFVEGPEYFVVTHDQSLDSGQFSKISIEDKADLPKVNKLSIIGGGELNASLARLGLIDEIILDVEPILLGSGIRLFGSQELQLKLKFLKSRKIGPATVQNHYMVQK